ncbi:uncharacterized protein MYCFIDRAFT_178487 [Pseudocercospora fijiensis CIRAD86]|uniref:Uncharacterized protein n=1 Tax=Pseudocercospora fijiensis (strain CIRAD86) TaxID=383855 RepID=M2YKT8_PSEFD|nr:uncharacterized protein MYCFIDRAFT_178487 [Pseudocercospora fijiensis CIRAD86]EME78340.1 hypothetical protein MYCFIDRAFT_178487 [Pseudocercospora fijiensis CIRAD86]
MSSRYPKATRHFWYIYYTQDTVSQCHRSTLQHPFWQPSAIKNRNMASFNREQHALDADSTTMRLSSMSISTPRARQNDSLKPNRRPVQQQLRPHPKGFTPDLTRTQPRGALKRQRLSAAPLFKREIRNCIITPGSKLDRCTLIDVAVSSCHLTRCSIKSENLTTQLQNCLITDCKISDVEIHACEIQSTLGEKIHDATERHFDCGHEVYRQGGASTLKRCDITQTKILHAQASHCRLANVAAKYLLATTCQIETCHLMTCEFRKHCISLSNSCQISESTSYMNDRPDMVVTSTGNDLQLLNKPLTPPTANPLARKYQMDPQSTLYPAQRREREGDIDGLRLRQGLLPLADGQVEGQRRHMLDERTEEAVAAVHVKDFRDALRNGRFVSAEIVERWDVVGFDRSRHRSCWRRMMDGDENF